MLADRPILYSFRRCPYAMRARMAIAMSGTTVSLREVLLRDKPEEMIAISPKATVPVLQDGETVIDESLAIMRWALGRNDPENWLRDLDASSALIIEADGPFKHNLDRYKYSTRYEDANRDEHRAAGMEFLQKLETALADNAFLIDDKRALADMAIFPFVRQFRIADEAWFDEAPLPRVQKWLAGLMGADLFQSVMRKYPSWKETGEEFEFLA